MNEDLLNIQEKIHQLKGPQKVITKNKQVTGYGVSMVIMIDLFSCIFVGLSMGLLFQKFFHTSVLLTVGFTFLGGIAGFYSVIRRVIRQDKK